MNLFDFITDFEIDQLPRDDDERFIEFYRITHSKLEGILAHCGDNEEGWTEAKEAKFKFVTILSAFAQAYKIDGISNFNIPNFGNFSDDVYRNFIADVEQAVTHRMLTRSRKAYADSVYIRPDDKTRIRSYIQVIRDIIDKSDWGPKEKLNLLEKLNDFEDKLNDRRLSLSAVALIALAFAQAPGGFGSSWDVLNKMYSKVMEVVAESRDTEKEVLHIPEHRKTSLPREAPKSLPRPKPSDDEVPF